MNLKKFFKLLNIAVYGKTMENVDKRRSIKLGTRWESKVRKLGARALIAKFNFRNVLHFTDDICRVTQPQQLINLIRYLILIASRKVALSI